MTKNIQVAQLALELILPETCLCLFQILMEEREKNTKEGHKKDYPGDRQKSREETTALSLIVCLLVSM